MRCGVGGVPCHNTGCRPIIEIGAVRTTFWTGLVPKNRSQMFGHPFRPEEHLLFVVYDKTGPNVEKHDGQNMPDQDEANAFIAGLIRFICRTICQRENNTAFGAFLRNARNEAVESYRLSKSVSITDIMSDLVPGLSLGPPWAPGLSLGPPWASWACQDSFPGPWAPGSPALDPGPRHKGRNNPFSRGIYPMQQPRQPMTTITQKP